MDEARPNILFVFADQMRASSVGFAGEEPVITPNLDAFAGQGVRFTRAIANAPLCCPMRASILTGQHPLTHGIVANDILMREDVPCIAKSLGEVGYDTAYIGKWHLDGPDRSCFTPPGPRRQGFHYWAASNCIHSYFESYYYRDDPEPIRIDGYEPTAQTDLAIDYVSSPARRERPFCLFLSWGPPHCPYDQAPNQFREMYDPERITLRPNVTDAKREIIAGYYAHITALDWNFGRLLNALDQTGLAENTLVIFTSDHGDMLFSHNRGWKCKPYRESVGVPFIARWPGNIPAGSVEAAPFGLANITPTILSLCGVDVPADMQGTPYPQMLLSHTGPRPKSTPIYHYAPATYPTVPEWRGIVTETHTFARFRDRDWILYNDSDDPYQMRILVDVLDCRKELSSKLDEWLSQMGDAFETGHDLVRRLGLDVNEHDIVRYYYGQLRR